MKRGEEPQAWTKAMTVHSHPLPYAIVEYALKGTCSIATLVTDSSGSPTLQNRMENTHSVLENLDILESQKATEEIQVSLTRAFVFSSRRKKPVKNRNGKHLDSNRLESPGGTKIQIDVFG
ncbi:hypothetical protein OUZ56_018543 [Daphnia magna]|uniref:Uncharacterized protein n=1 Tax=Daphnia magna TaxID=35525 RepID=A0ABQ9ZAA2_9CRUS|nr:hypothetical protein OUZ56_018543 [Daphnia magna]